MNSLMKEELAPVREFARRMRVLSLAVVESGVPHAAPLYYACNDQLRPVFLSRPEARHAQAVSSGAEVAFDIFEDPGDILRIRGIQGRGHCRRLEAGEDRPARKLYESVYPLARLPAILRGQWGSFAAYEICPSWICWTDNTLGFSRKREWTFGEEG
ncbi:MAG: hypothetical protein HQL31_10055 [Planctomycetes bacterium]|nr:hypothetical protein [Planctomycetota bacterium]